MTLNKQRKEIMAMPLDTLTKKYRILIYLFEMVYGCAVIFAFKSTPIYPAFLLSAPLIGGIYIIVYKRCERYAGLVFWPFVLLLSGAKNHFVPQTAIHRYGEWLLVQWSAVSFATLLLCLTIPKFLARWFSKTKTNAPAS